MADDVIEALEDSLTPSGALTAHRVEAVADACNGVFIPPEAGGVVRVEGVAHTFAFERRKLADYADEIRAMLAELPAQFHENIGGGWSFLKACMNRRGEQWTGMHVTMEKLFALGLAIGAVELLMPRELWEMLPGGVPYYVVKAVDRD